MKIIQLFFLATFLFGCGTTEIRNRDDVGIIMVTDAQASGLMGAVSGASNTCKYTVAGADLMDGVKISNEAGPCPFKFESGELTPSEKFITLPDSNGDGVPDGWFVDRGGNLRPIRE